MTAHRQTFARAAGVVVPLFSLRGADDAGTGEILDLIPFTDWLADGHQRLIQLLPINETAPREASPYNTLSAFALDPTYIAASRAADVVRSAAAQAWLRSPAVQQRVRRRRRGRRQRHAVYIFQLRLLELGFEEFVIRDAAAEHRRFADFCGHNAWWLDDYALFRALKEQRRWTSWETWPEPLRSRNPEALAEAAAALAPRLRFFRYVQWIAAQQWQEARAHARRRGVLVHGDLPFVCGRDSADVWAHQELFDLSSSAGAPPDAFSATGQAWGLPLYNWNALRRSRYEWWRQRARQARDLYDLFRVDHVIGLYRTYAIPVHQGGTAGFVPPHEADQLEQGRSVLDAILAETANAASVVAEDLGTVPDWARQSLTALGIPGYKVFRWECRDHTYLDPRAYAPLSVATTGTHDTDTLAAWWEGLTEEERIAIVRSLDLAPCAEGTRDLAMGWSDAHVALLRRLYEAGSTLTVLPIQDLFGWRQRINTPATIDRQNWTYRLPAPIDALDRQPGVRARMAMIRSMIDDSGRYS